MEFAVAENLGLTGHVVAMPYPSQGHVNSMINLCNQLASLQTSILITIVVTQEWLGLIASHQKHTNIRFATIPNVIPLQSQIASDITAFFQAAVTNLQPPFCRLLHRLHPDVTALLADVELQFPVALARLMDIPVALLWTMSASFFLSLDHLQNLVRNGALKADLLDDREEHIPGISPAQLADLGTVLRENDLRFLQLELECISVVSKADCLIVNSVQGLEAEAIGSLRGMFHFPIYPIAFPYFKPEASHSVSYSDYKFDYLNWLDSQPAMSVLYISLGSFLSVSCAQMNEIVSALETSGVRYLWVVRGEVSWLKEKCGDRGSVVPWCDQLKVLSHPSVGGF
ncbi:UDP-glycosyltransferase protein [Vigna angularis]|uniref:UDP-glycosyltransferase protein n=1 Tax=Phaseolus angularis TaxID=3914 RepID=A0A8T0KH35_PHAAN|nr:UDP-glycosyltransferase protein [Vigna angularis]